MSKPVMPLTTIDSQAVSDSTSIEEKENLSLSEKVRDGSNSRVFGLFILFAAILVIARLLAPFQVGKDQASQLEAAERLAAGQGITTGNVPSPESPDIANAPDPIYLTHWPPAFSLMVAGLLKLGIPLLASLKLIYGVVTLIGWIGWAAIASRLMSKSFTWGRRSIPVQYIIPVFLPLFRTPLWQGTDIFLWALIPPIILWLLKSRDSGSIFVYTSAAGLAVGCLYSFRYASAFLGLAALLILLQVSFPDIKSAIKRASIFAISSLAIIVPTMIFIKLYSQHDSVLPETFGDPSATSYIGLALGMVEGSSITSMLLFGFKPIYSAVVRLDSLPISVIFGMSSVVLLFVLPLIVFRRSAQNRKEYQQDLALSLSLLPISLVIFLFLSTLRMANALFGIARYYEPVMLCCPLIFYALANSSATSRMTRFASRGFVLLFTIQLCLYAPLAGLVPGRSQYFIQDTLGFIPSKSEGMMSTSLATDYPGYQIYSPKENSRNKLRELFKAHPDAVFFLDEYPYFAYETGSLRTESRSMDLRGLPVKTFWNSAFTSRPLKVFWVLELGTPGDSIPDPNGKVIYNDPFEKTRILESDYPAGHRFFKP